MSHYNPASYKRLTASSPAFFFKLSISNALNGSIRMLLLWITILSVENRLVGSAPDTSIKSQYSHQFMTSFRSPQRKFDNFSRLKPRTQDLFGSRWTIEQKTAIHVQHSVEVVDTTLIISNELILRVDFNLRQMWTAEGLELPYGLFKDNDDPDSFVTAGESVLAHMWSPDSYISTARESNVNTAGAPLSLVYIFKNSSIIFKTRMFTKVSCSSNFEWYPLDIQSCNLVVESYKYPVDIVQYVWSDENVYRPIVVRMRRLFQYELKSFQHSNGSIVRGGGGTKYSYVRLRFIFERRLGNSLIQVYTPTVLVVVLSWFSFWLGLDAVPGRISLLVTCILTLVTMHSGLKESIPPVHYITMMDVWYVCCNAFVFGAICEFVVVKYLYWRHEQNKVVDEKTPQEETRLYSIFKHHSDEINTRLTSLKSVNGRRKNGKVYPMEQGIGRCCGPTYPENDRDGMQLQQSQPLNLLSDNFLRCVIVEEKSKVDGFSDKCTNSQVRNGHTEKFTKFPIWIRLDRLSRVLSPLLFFTFNCIYWPLLFCGSNSYESNIYDG